MTTNFNDTLRGKLTDLLSASQDDTNPEYNSAQIKNEVLLRRPAPTYKQIHTADSLRVEFFAALVDLLANISTNQTQSKVSLPLWLSQRIAWFYVNQFYLKINQDLELAGAEVDSVINKENVRIYVQQNLAFFVSAWLSKANLINSKNLLFSLEKYATGGGTRIIYDECSIKNKRRTMEDKVFIIESICPSCDSNAETNSLSIFSLFDGHCGVECAEFVSKHLPLELLDACTNDSLPSTSTVSESMFKASFRQVNAKFSRIAHEQSLRSGATACVCMLTDSNRLLHVAWCGDSQFCLIKNRRVEFLTDIHKPDSETEKRRIEAAGGYVSCTANTWRINDVLAVSRSFGDVAFQTNEMVTCQPDYKRIELDGSEEYFVLGCDGFFEHIDFDEELIRFVEERLSERDNCSSAVSSSEATELEHVSRNSLTSANMAELLVNRAKANGSSDNISVIFAQFK